MAKAKENKAPVEEKEKKEKGPSKSKIQCVKCKTWKSVRPEVLQKRIEKAGSEEKLRASYLCLQCRPKAEKKPAKKEE